MLKSYKLVVYVPLTHADVVRDSLAKAGAGKLGNYSACSFSSRGVGRYKPEQGADPAIGEVGKLESVEEERIEVVCMEDAIKEVIVAMKKVHPYEEIAYDVFEMVDL